MDVGNSFGAPALTEDNLVAALRRCGRRLALLGDDTWLQLFPPRNESGGGAGGGAADGGGSAFAIAHPFPSFNVADLHTVDAGVAAHLTPLLTEQHGALTRRRTVR